MGVGCSMLLAHLEEPQVGIKLKGVFGKTVKFLVHDKPQRFLWGLEWLTLFNNSKKPIMSIK